VYKIAMIPKSKEDVEIIYELTNYFKENYKWKDFIFISMWELWKQTRIDIPKVWGIITFWTKDNRWTAPWQIHFKKLQNKLYS
jgi:3-dehydroquinate dehydratase